MNLLAELRLRFRRALEAWGGDLDALVDMVRPSQDPRFGDYQANCAMPLGKRLGRPPRDVAAELVERVDVDDLCERPTIEGPGFINLRLRASTLESALRGALTDERLGVAAAFPQRTYVVDYSAPNVAKPMHVGHIRSTVIGDALVRLLRFLGHRVIGDNHVGDWGTQFGMILFGYKHLLDAAAYEADPVGELSRLYRLVNQLVDYHAGRADVPRREQDVARQREQLARLPLPASQDKPTAKERRRAEAALREAEEELAALRVRLSAVAGDRQLAALAARFERIGEQVLAETARLHAGDPENRRLWREFLPPCLADIERIYARLGVRFDCTLGESFYQDRLAAVADDLLARGLARVSEGAVCVFLDDGEPPLIVRKQDGAFLYATTDLATIQYRVETWQPDAVLYVVDHRQSLHFQQLFAVARQWGYGQVEFAHVSFGTVLGDDGRPFKTRSGDTIGLTGLIDEAVERALAVVSTNDDQQPGGPQLSAERRREIAQAVGIGALKYADLSQNRTSDYVFSYDKMLAMNGNTATYMQYAYARVRSIFAKGALDPAALRHDSGRLVLDHPAERALALSLVRLSESLAAAVDDYRPNVLTGYLFELANHYSTFFDQCPVLKADSEAVRHVRLVLCDLTARTLQLGLALLGIDVVEKM
jgi:arginyl-tRNA synthetase